MKIGYQLFSALQLCQTKQGMVDTIEKIAAMGYDGVEFFAYAGMEAQELKELLGKNHLEGFNSHVQLERWMADPEGEIRYAAEAGISCVTIPWLPAEMRYPEGYAKIKALAVKIQPIAKKYGITLLYHNHDFEFAKDSGGVFWLENILKATPEMKLELDTFWAYYAGIDPVAYMEKHKAYLRLIHVKDYKSFKGGPIAGGAEMPVFCAIGTGKMNNKKIVDWAKKNDVQWVCVEQDNSQISELEAAKISIQALREM